MVFFCAKIIKKGGDNMQKNSLDLLKLIKKASIDTVNSSKPVNLIYGVVVSKSPLEIQIDQKLILQESQLVLTRNVTDYSLNMIIDYNTQMVYEHSHSCTGEKTFSVLNALKEGDSVILVRIQKGEKFVVLDRVGVI